MSTQCVWVGGRHSTPRRIQLNLLGDKLRNESIFYIRNVIINTLELLHLPINKIQLGCLSQRRRHSLAAPPRPCLMASEMNEHKYETAARRKKKTTTRNCFVINFPVIIDIVAEHHDDYHILQLYKLGWILQETRFATSLNAEKRIIFQARREISPRKVLLARTEYDLWMLLKSDELHEWLGKEDVSCAVASENFFVSDEILLLETFNGFELWSSLRILAFQSNLRSFSREFQFGNLSKVNNDETAVDVLE